MTEIVNTPVHASPLGLRLFLEGIEVPVIAASVDVQPDRPANASIQIIPTDMSMYLLPRTLVHLFYLDSSMSDAEVEAANKILQDKGADIDSNNRRMTADASDLNRFQASDFSYKLLFSGEVIGFNYKKTPNGRQMVLQCMDLSSYWDTCYQWFADYSVNGNALTDKTHNFVGAGQGLFDNFGGHDWVLSGLLGRSPRSPEFQDAKGLLGGLIHMLEAIGGVRYRNKNFKGYKGVSDFFTIAELRYNLLGQLGAIPADKTSANLYASKAFNQWIMNGMTSIGSLVSFRDILNHINRYIFHNIYPNPSAMLIPGKDRKIPQKKKTGEENIFKNAVGATWKKDINQALEKLYKGQQGLEYTIQALMRLEAGTVEVVGIYVWMNPAYEAIRDADDILARMIPVIEAVSDSRAKPLVANLRKARSEVTHVRRNIPAGSPSQKYYQNDEVSRRNGSYLLKGLLDAKGRIIDAQKILTEKVLGLNVNTYRRYSIKVEGADRLPTQLFLPETYFACPPKCNVIFPDQYSDLQFSRNFLRETSRLAMQGGLGMLGGGRRGSELFTSQYLAPRIRDVNNKLLQAATSQGSRVLLQHEVHSGIIPKFSWVTDGHKWGVKAATGTGNLGKIKKSRKLHYLQRLAEFQFYLNRWSARQLSVNGLFNPNIVCGFPGVVIDRSAPSPAVLEVLERTLNRRMLPTQFLGKIHSYNHSISQDGGYTSINYIYARTHRGLDDEFFGTLSKEIQIGTSNKVEARAVDLSFFSTGKDEAKKYIVKLYLEDKLRSGADVPKVGKIDSWVGLGTRVWLNKTRALSFGISVDTFNRKSFPARAVDLAWLPADIEEVKKKNPYVETVEDLEGRFGDISVPAVAVPEKLVVYFKGFRGTGKYAKNDIPFEDAVRPQWVAENIWSNKTITKMVYDPLIGSSAITDDVSLGKKAQEELLRQWKDDQKSRKSAEQGGGTVDTQSAAGDTKFEYPLIEGSVEEAVDGLSLIYGMLREKGGGVHEFIQSFTRRPIANMIDVLGSQNLEFDDRGRVIDTRTMIEGFHSRAFGDYNTDVELPEKPGGPTKPGKKALSLLYPGEASPEKVERPALLGKDEQKSAITPQYDPRGRSRSRVRAYVAELNISTGLLGS